MESFYCNKLSRNRDMVATTKAEPQYHSIPYEDEDIGISKGSHDVDVWRWRFYALLVFTVFITTLLTTSLLYAITRSSPICSSITPDIKVPYSPAPVKYVNRNLTSDFGGSSFMGYPRPELDKAWHDLLNGTAIRISEEEVELINATNVVRLKEGGYIGGLGMMHSLHCLKRIKQYLHPKYYYTQEQVDWDGIYVHIDHCLESLRTQTLCRPDLSLYTFTWTPESNIKPAVQVTQESVCVDWEEVHEWMKARAATIHDVIGPLEM